ncbi:DNA-processing protein DprA [Litoribrevibacter albus]|uniref:DNA processing protein DprA n=1 Tax=Litoribrevibacter albus TaxID=1473156 RepID=A0AA37W9P4_9GAMM|nr:DNA-processing protein DprA [Litoribrevibacter albus]GLQ32936.1 DNA processing protein DprA [Litoribrevibacter albus]
MDQNPLHPELSLEALSQETVSQGSASQRAVSPSTISQRTLDWLTLSLIPGLSSRTLIKLRQVYAEPGQLISVIRDGEWRHLPFQKAAKDWLTTHSSRLGQVFEDQIEKTLVWLESGGFLLDWQSPEYPSMLQEIYDPPVLLYGLGQPHCLQEHQSLAMVGSRKATRYGIELANEFAYQLGHLGWQVVSGLALGIDGAAHQGALQAVQEGACVSTVAVVATGLDQTYPASHRQLKEQIIESGCVISEYPLGTLPKANFFPRRNRIISGLCHGVLVVEASEKSGSLVSARCALEQNRDVFAIPGALNNPQAVGCHSLIQQGAKLVTCVEDILEEYTTTSTPQSPKAAVNLKKAIPKVAQGVVSSQPDLLDDRSQSAAHNPLPSDSLESQDPVLAAIGNHIATADELIIRTGLTWPELSQKLLTLELAGLILSTQGGYSLKTN